MVKNLKGDLLASDCQYICHQVNCRGKMNSGIAKSIREKWPKVYESYLTKFAGKFVVSPIGTIQIVTVYDDFDDRLCVVNMFSQQDYGYDGQKYTSYDAFWACLQKISETVPAGAKIGFPKNIGCCRGGANWNVISTMIAEVLGDKYDVAIYEYDGG